MSATGRNKAGNERDRLDRYDTPRWCIDALLSHRDTLHTLHSLLDRSRPWIEPCVGEGRIVHALNDKLGVPKAGWECCDLEPRARPDLVGPFQTVEEADGISKLRASAYGACITNPPYTLATEFAEAALERCLYVALLLRLSWAGAAKRAAFLREHPPTVLALPNRPSFTADGRTDAATYAWFTWSRLGSGAWQGSGFFHVLRPIPKEKRRR